MKYTMLMITLLCGVTNAAELGLYVGGQTGSSETKGGGTFLGVMNVPANDYVSVAFQGGLVPSSSKVSTLSAAEVNIASVEMVPKLSLPLGDFKPYLSVGVGYFMPSERLDDSVNQAANLFALTAIEHVKNAVGGVFGGGFDYKLTDNISVGIDLAYLYVKTQAQSTVISKVSAASLSVLNDVDLSTFRGLVGFRIKFDGTPVTHDDHSSHDVTEKKETRIEAEFNRGTTTSALTEVPPTIRQGDRAVVTLMSGTVFTGVFSAEDTTGHAWFKVGNKTATIPLEKIRSITLEKSPSPDKASPPDKKKQDAPDSMAF